MKYLILFVCILAGGHVIAQQKEWPPAEWKDTTVREYRTRASIRQTRNFKGYLILQNGDTIRGYMEHVFGGYRVLPVDKFKEEEIPFSQIRFIRADIASFEKDHIEMTGGYWKEPLRLLGNKGVVCLYDHQQIVAPGKLGAPLVLVTGGTPIQIYDYDQLYRGQGHIRGLVVKFVNKRYGVALPKDYFKTNQEVVDYLVDKESERLRGEGK